MATLRTDYINDILAAAMDGKRQYRMIQNANGTVSFEDVTVYDQNGDTFSAGDVNGIDAQVNANTENIATNTSNIATNTANIATNTANIATNTANIKSLSDRIVSLGSINPNSSKNIKMSGRICLYAFENASNTDNTIFFAVKHSDGCVFYYIHQSEYISILNTATVGTFQVTVGGSSWDKLTEIVIE